jgi:cytochrome c oxidase assembly protein subunit 15
LAWVLVCAVFPLIWLGGTVTTYEAGMAVEDWPTTYGHWFYPIQQWLGATWDLFLEHGHRMLAQVVGLVTIALAVVIWRCDPRKWMRYVAVAVVAGVVLQGVLGGLRVLGDERILANVHGCTAPLVFGLCAAVVALTSAAWRRTEPPQEHPAARRLHRWTTATVVGIYALIVLGAQLRHPLPHGGHGWFLLYVWIKVIAALLMSVNVVWLMVFVLHRVQEDRMVAGRAKLLAALFLVQLALGAGTWITNFGYPAWFRNYITTIPYTVTAEGPLQVIVTTAHAAAGSLCLIVALSLALWSRRRHRSLNS